MNRRALCATLIFAFLFQTLIVLLLIPTVEAQNLPWFEIVNVVTRKDDGTPSSTFKRGEFVFVEVTVKRTDGAYYYYTEESFLLIVRASMGSPPTLWGLGAFRGSLAVNDEMTAAPAFQIPTNAPTGTMEITVYVWSDWAAYGGVPLATPYTVTITVTD